MIGKQSIVILLVLVAIFTCTANAASRPMASPFSEGSTLQAGEIQSRFHFPMLKSVGDAVDFDQALIDAADYLRAMQADITEDNAGNGTDGIDEYPDDPDDGGWDWRVTSPPDPVHHTTNRSPDNLYGETAQGLYLAYLETGDPTYLVALTDCADWIKAPRDSFRTAADIIFLINYNDLPEVSGTEYADSAKAKFDGVIATYGSAAAWARHIRDVRASQGYENGIIPWDIGAWVRAAAMLADKYPSDPYDYAAAADSMAEVLWQDSFNDNPGYFDVEDDAGWDSTYANKNYWWYTLGLCGLIDAFNASALHTSEIAGLVTRLLDSQYPSGAISGSYGAHDNDEDWQSTAYGAMVLARLDKSTYQSDINMMGYYLGATQDVIGGWKYASNNHYPEVAGECAAALYYTTNEIPDGISVDPASVRCLNAAFPCDTVEVVFKRRDTTPVRGFSVTFTLSSELELCDPDVWASIREGTYLSNVAGPNTHFEVVSNGGGSYTVDCAILGLPCGATGDGVLFTIDVKGSGGDGTGTITVTSVTVRDCSNGSVIAFPGPPVEITIDHTPPEAIVDLTATQIKSGNDADGTTGIRLNFTPPSDAAVVEVYRAPFGDYPEYDDGTGAEPATPPTYPPGAPWQLTSVTADGEIDEPANRDFWYYVAYVKDACGNVSSVSNKTTGTLNYHLGDVTDGVTPGNGDNRVNSVDISLLGAHYWSTLVHNDPFNYLDVGPTTDYTVDGRPTTDNQIQFEDLMMFAINFGQVTFRSSPMPRIVEHPELDLDIDQSLSDRVVARLVLNGNRSSVKGLHSIIDFDDGLEVVRVSRGSLWDEQASNVFFENRVNGNQVEIDGAVMGAATTLIGSGTVCEIEFRVTGTVRELPRLSEVDIRDRFNRQLTLRSKPRKGVGESQEPADNRVETRLEFMARPNPFAGKTDLCFAIQSPMRVSLKIYDTSGRLVATIIDEVLSAGRHQVSWSSQGVSPGVYLIVLEAGADRKVQKLTLLP